MIVPIFLLAKKTPNPDQFIDKQKQHGMPEGVSPDTSGIGSAMSATETLLLKGEFQEHAEKLRELRQSISEETAEAIDDYNNEMAKVGYFDFPHNHSLNTKTDLERARLVIAKCREIAQNYRTAESERVKEFPGRVKELNLPPASQEVVLQTFESARVEALTLADKFWSAEFRRIKILEEMVILLESTHGRWNLSDNGEIKMQNPDDQASLAALLEAAEHCFTEQDNIRSRHKEKTKEIQARHPSLRVN